MTHSPLALFFWFMLLATVDMVYPYAKPGVAQSVATGPSAIWPAGPLEVIATFNLPLDRAVAESLINKRISCVDPKMPKFAGTLRIAGARLIDDGRTLVLATDPHASAGATSCHHSTRRGAALDHQDSRPDLPTA